MPTPLRVGVIGSTGRGNYGHGLDTVWKEIEGVQVVAVADDNPAGLAAAVKRLEGAKGYADYRNMLDEAKPAVVSICPRWLDQHRDMVLAAAERGVTGIYMEKPMCRTLAEADEMIAACEKHNVKLAIAFQTRYSPKVHLIKNLLDDGAIGTVLEYHARGKEDGRGGGEDLWVLGTHLFNLIHFFAGEPTWCFASLREKGEPVTKAHLREGNEGIGPLAGDSVQAMYRMTDGTTAYFNSTRNAGGKPSRFGLQIHGSAGVMQMFDTGYLPSAFILKDAGWSPGRTGAKWLPISSAGIDQPEPLKDGGLHAGNVRAVKDLLDAIEHDRQPEASMYEALVSTQMIVAVFESQRVGAPVRFPLENRRNPLVMLGE